MLEIGPLDPAVLRGGPRRDAADDGISLSRLLSTLVDEVSLEEGDGGHLLRLEKRVPLTRPETREPV